MINKVLIWFSFRVLVTTYINNGTLFVAGLFTLPHIWQRFGSNYCCMVGKVNSLDRWDGSFRYTASIVGGVLDQFVRCRYVNKYYLLFLFENRQFSVKLKLFISPQNFDRETVRHKKMSFARILSTFPEYLWTPPSFGENWIFLVIGIIS